MKRLLPIFVLLALPVAAQENRGAASAPSGGGGGGAVHGGSSGSGAGPATHAGGSSGGSGGSSSSGSGSGSSTASSGGGGGGRVEAGGRHAATGGSGVAISRPDRGNYTAGGRAVANAGNGSGNDTTAGKTSGTDGARATGRRDGTPREARTPDGGAAGVPPHARPRNGDEPITGMAVPRGSVPPPVNGGGPIVIQPPWYPWWFGGVGYYGGYYGGYYDPWFGGYYGSYPDPQPTYGGPSYSDEGSLRLKIKPREAEVYVDGYYVGIVDDFDGVFQKLHLDSGPHRVEVRAPGYDTLAFDVKITPDHSTTYQGTLKKSEQ